MKLCEWEHYLTLKQDEKLQLLYVQVLQCDHFLAVMEFVYNICKYLNMVNKMLRLCYQELLLSSQLITLFTYGIL